MRRLMCNPELTSNSIQSCSNARNIDPLLLLTYKNVFSKRIEQLNSIQNPSESRKQLNKSCVDRLVQFFSTTSNKSSMRAAVDKIEDPIFDYSDMIEEEIEKLKYLINCLISYDSPIIEYDISKVPYAKLRDVAYNKQER